MMFGMSLGEVIVLVAASAWVFGPNELPRVARSAGRLTGQATGFLYRTRAKFFKFAEETEMTKLHEEVQATMYQLNAIRSELQGGVSLFQPGPLTQRALSIKPMPGFGDTSSAAALGQHAQQAAAQQGGSTWAASAAARPPAAAPSAAAAFGAATARPAAGLPQQAPAAAQQGAAGSWAAGAVLSADRMQTVQHLQQLGAAQEAAQQQQQRQQQHGAEQQQQSAAGQGQPSGAQLEGHEKGSHPLTVPVSAVAAGWAPDRSGSAPSGSEVMLDALAEELIAAQVLRLQQQQMATRVQQAAAQRQAAAQEQRPGAAGEQQEQGGALETQQQGLEAGIGKATP